MPGASCFESRPVAPASTVLRPIDLFELKKGFRDFQISRVLRGMLMEDIDESCRGESFLQLWPIFPV